LEEKCASHNNHYAARDRDAFPVSREVLFGIFGESAEAVHEGYEHQHIQKGVDTVVDHLVGEH